MTLAQQDAVLVWNEPSPVPLRGTLIVLPGRGESPEVYERFGRRLSADAYRVHAVSAPSDSAEQAHEQLLSVLDAADSATPRILVGSDAGAAYAAYLVASGSVSGVSGLILAGLPTATSPTPTSGAASTSDAATDWEAELDVRTSCPTHRSRISAAGVRPTELFAELPEEWLDPSTPARIDVPVLGVHGHADVLSPLDAARRWFSVVPCAELVSIAAGRHDVLNDQTHRSVAASVVLWLERLKANTDLAPIAVTEPLNEAVAAAR